MRKIAWCLLDGDSIFDILKANDKRGITMIGEKIRALRAKKGATQEAMANVLGVSPQAISKWEQNMTMPDISMLVPIADYFGVSVDYLLREQKSTEFIETEQFVEIVSKKDRKAWRCTVKNISDRELEQVKLKTYFYDEAGNSIDYSENWVSDLEPDSLKTKLLFSTVGVNAASIKVVVKSVEFANGKSCW